MWLCVNREVRVLITERRATTDLNWRSLTLGEPEEREGERLVLHFIEP